MLTANLVGTISLNLSFVLYLFVYVPQIIHNRNADHLAHLSVSMHGLLYMAYCLDLLYGFSNHLQWQYKTVSVVGLTLLAIQHLQLTGYFWTRQAWSAVQVHAIFLLITGLAVLYFFLIEHGQVSDTRTQTIGYLSRVCFLLYTLPQIIKNNALKSAQAISLNFLYLNISLSTLDLISAWCLDWGWPNKLGSPITACLMLVLLLQRRLYTVHTQTHAANSTRTCCER